MLYVDEFEIFPDGDMYAAVPFGLEGGTCGDDFDDAVEMAADWLYETVKHALINAQPLPDQSFGNGPEHEGGRIIAIAVSCDLAHVDAVTSADAARMLGVSSARVAQMCESGKLVSWRDGSKRMVLRESIDARLKEAPKAGRPKKAVAGVA